MARVILLLSVVCLAAAVVSAQKSSLDSVDVDAVMKNERLLKNYADCLLDKKPCSKEGAELKNRIPKVLDNTCDDCSDNEKEKALKVIRFVIKEKPEIWKDVKAKFDPTGEKTEAFAKRFNIEGA